MSPEAQRIALAQICHYRGTPEQPVNPEFAAYYFEILPDYLNNYDHIRDAEAVLDEEQVAQYESTLIKVAGSLSEATPGQRAEALLRTLELWKEQA
jgi:hypothetical protein